MTSACADKTGLPHDACVSAHIARSAHAAEVQGLAHITADPVVRDAAVILWVQDHRATITPTEGRELCSALTRQEAPICLRRLEAAHLSR